MSASPCRRGERNRSIRGEAPFIMRRAWRAPAELLNHWLRGLQRGGRPHPMDRGDNGHEKLYCILSIDGGGIRGLIAARILVTLEAKLQARTGNPDTKLADYFDLIAGTSTGGILACVYLYPEGDTGRPRYSAVAAQ